MMKNKRYASYIMVALMMFSLFSPLAHASEPYPCNNAYEVEICISPNETVTVIVPIEYQNIEGIEKQITDFVNLHSFSAGNIITIHNIVDFENSSCNMPEMCAMADGSIETQAFNYQYDTTIVAQSAERTLETIHIMSVAKGLTKTFGVKTTFKKGFKFVSGDNPFNTATAEFEKTVEYSATFVFTGPPEGSSNNSRNYYIDFIGVTAYWTQDKMTGTGTLVDTRSGYGEICTGYWEYSLDSYIS